MTPFWGKSIGWGKTKLNKKLQRKAHDLKNQDVVS
jgi:hypothetical protein